MKVLVFDDNAQNRAAAKAQLKGHDVTVVGTYDEAQALLKPRQNEDKAKDYFAAKFGDRNPYARDGFSAEKRTDRMAFYRECEEKATVYPDFDAVLTDLLVPASSQAQGNREHVGEEMPVGIFIGLLAAAKTGAKYVAVFTDSDHHSHPASACFDAFNAGEGNPTPFSLNGTRVLLSNTRNWVNNFNPSDMTTMVDLWEDLPNNVSVNQRQKEWTEQGKVCRAKNWAALLEYIVNYDEKEA